MKEMRELGSELLYRTLFLGQERCQRAMVHIMNLLGIQAGFLRIHLASVTHAVIRVPQRSQITNSGTPCATMTALLQFFWDLHNSLTLIDFT